MFASSSSSKKVLGQIMRVVTLKRVLLHFALIFKKFISAYHTFAPIKVLHLRIVFMLHNLRSNFYFKVRLWFQIFTFYLTYCGSSLNILMHILCTSHKFEFVTSCALNAILTGVFDSIVLRFDFNFSICSLSRFAAGTL